MSTPVPLSADEARRWLVHTHGLAVDTHPEGVEGARSLLAARRCIQLDPLDAIGTNADLVALARVHGLRQGDIYSALLPGHAFEHFAKERCLLPASAWPHYRDQAVATPWWRTSERMRRLTPEVLDAVESEVRQRGPLPVSELTDRGRIEPLDWSGWKSTPFRHVLAVETLWVQCRVLVVGRGKRSKVVDVPERALPEVHDAPTTEPFTRWALRERVAAAGLLARATGPAWGQLGSVRTTLPDQAMAEGWLEAVTVPGSRRPYLAPAGFRDIEWQRPDDRMRILGPLDPLLWDRKLVRQVWDFDYVWEVYKPAAKRRWGWYVCPLLHRGKLVGRLEAAVERGRIEVRNLWPEPGHALDRDALNDALARHENAIV